MITSLLLSNWKLVAIAALSAALGLMTHLWLGAEDGKKSLEIEFKLKVAQAEAQTKEVRDRSTKTVETINANHQALLAKAESNAVANYLKAHPPGSGRPVGLGSGTFGVLPTTPLASTASLAESASRAYASPGECVPPERFIKDCADDALQVTEWQRWARGNKLPIEGE